MEVKGEEPSDERVEWTVGVKTSKPKIDDEHEEDSDNSCGAGAVYAKVGASQKDIQPGQDKGTAAAQTQMPSTKPKARTLVAGRRLIDGNEVASLRDQSHPTLLTLKGTVSLAAPDPRSSSSLHASITGEASVSAVVQDAAVTEPGLNRQLSNISREEIKKQYYKDLCKQVEERKQQRERERRKNAADEQKHNETVQRSIWGMPGSGAPNYHLGTVRRTNSLHHAGILPQEQIRDKGFSGIPFHRL